MTVEQTSTPKPSISASAEEDAYLTAQLAVDALVDLPGPTAPYAAQESRHQTRWTLFGQNWWRILCSGSWFLVRPYMRGHLEPHRDTSLTLSDCTAQMRQILTQLQGLDESELAAAARAMVAARDAALQKAEGAVANSRSTSRSDGQATVWSPGARRLAVEVQARQVSINELRVGLPTMPWWEPTGPNDRFLRLGIDYGVYYRTGLVRQIDGEQGEAAARTIANPPLTAEQALAGLDRLHRELTEMTPRRRTIAFAAIDWAWANAAPLSA